MENIKIFIVDDNVFARRMLTKILSENEEFIVAGEAATAQGAIIMLDEVAPDLVLLEMSVAGGMEINNIIKEIKNFSPNVKIILIADANSQKNVISAAKIGADDFISKPYKSVLISRVIKKVMN